MALRISLGLAMLSMAFALCATAATDQEDTWVENEWNEESSPKLKTLSMLHNGAGGVCMQVQLPEFVPTEIVKHGTLCHATSHYSDDPIVSFSRDFMLCGPCHLLLTHRVQD